MTAQLPASSTFNVDKQAIGRVTNLIDKGNAVLATAYSFSNSVSNGCMIAEVYLDEKDFYGWRTQAISFLVGLLDENHVYVNGFQEHCEAAYPGSAKAGIGILQSVLDDLQNGHLQTLKELVRANTFSDFLEMADHLLSDGGYKDAAAVMAGSTLEAHLRNLALKNGIAIERQTSSGMVPKKADALNADMAAGGAYAKLDQKSITAWLGLRNAAAHGNYSTYTDDQVKLMIQGIRDFISRIPA